MRCPNNDGSIVFTKTTLSTGNSVDIGQCTTCKGYWLDGFDVNYIDIQRLDSAPPSTLSLKPTLFCPLCTTELQQVKNDTVPPNVLLFQDPNHHGYFFPAGQLYAFKHAQESKITYHKLWGIPLGSLTGTLLTGLLGVVVSMGLVLGAIEGQKETRQQLQAEEILTRVSLYVSENTSSVTIAALTSEATKVTITLEDQNSTKELTTQDGLSHIIRLTNISKGTYMYHLTYIQNGLAIYSKTYSFTFPR